MSRTNLVRQAHLCPEQNWRLEQRRTGYVLVNRDNKAVAAFSIDTPLPLLQFFEAATPEVVLAWERDFADLKGTVIITTLERDQLRAGVRGAAARMTDRAEARYLRSLLHEQGKTNGRSR